MEQDKFQPHEKSNRSAGQNIHWIELLLLIALVIATFIVGLFITPTPELIRDARIQSLEVHRSSEAKDLISYSAELIFTEQLKEGRIEASLHDSSGRLISNHPEFVIERHHGKGSTLPYSVSSTRQLKPTLRSRSFLRLRTYPKTPLRA